MPMQHCYRDGRLGDGCFRNGRVRTQASASSQAINPSLEGILRGVVLLGMVLVIALPAARGDSQWFGALPLWLVGMPLASWWALHRFRLPLRLARANKPLGSTRRRPGRPQAWRRTPISRLPQRDIPRVA